MVEGVSNAAVWLFAAVEHFTSRSCEKVDAPTVTVSPAHSRGQALMMRRLLGGAPRVGRQWLEYGSCGAAETGRCMARWTTMASCWRCTRTEAYVTPEVWSIISQETSRRGIGVPNQEEIESHREAVRAEQDELQPPRLPWKWQCTSAV